VAEPDRFKDHFSDRSADYARYRPEYPGALFDFIAQAAPRRNTAVDAATGSGQLALGLAGAFTRVIAIDASAEQIANAPEYPGVEYRTARAEATGLPGGSVDALTVGQALHWFDIEAFGAEAERLLAGGGLLVCVSYGLCEVVPEVDAAVRTLYADVLDSHWPPERALVESGYADVRLPGLDVPAPEFAMLLHWRVDDMLGYLRTWSAAKRYRQAEGHDAVVLVEERLRGAWGSGPRPVRWPLTVIARRLGG